jgi:hypothetical protein
VAGRLVAATGVAVIATGIFTLNGGLELAGSPLAVSRIAETLSGTAPRTPPQPRSPTDSSKS